MITPQPQPDWVDRLADFLPPPRSFLAAVLFSMLVWAILIGLFFLVVP